VYKYNYTCKCLEYVIVYITKNQNNYYLPIIMFIIIKRKKKTDYAHNYTSNILDTIIVQPIRSLEKEKI
jgi:hypothetical protein